jgi:thioredoxin reductase (NADPH)
MRCHVVDSLEAVGGQLSALYPEKPIYDIPGFPRVNALDLVHRLEEQAAPFHPVYHLGRQVTGVTRQPDDRFLVEAGADTRILARAVVIAAGAGAFGPNRPPLKGLEAFEGRSVFYLVRRREDFRGKRVVIAGGGDSAVDWAVSLAELAAHVAVVQLDDSTALGAVAVLEGVAMLYKGKDRDRSIQSESLGSWSWTRAEEAEFHTRFNGLIREHRRVM